MLRDVRTGIVGLGATSIAVIIEAFILGESLRTHKSIESLRSQPGRLPIFLEILEKRKIPKKGGAVFTIVTRVRKEARKKELAS